MFLKWPGSKGGPETQLFHSQTHYESRLQVAQLSKIKQIATSLASMPFLIFHNKNERDAKSPNGHTLERETNMSICIMAFILL